MKSKCLFYRRPSSLITVFGKMIGAFVFYIVQLEMSFGFVSSLKPPLPYKFCGSFSWLDLVGAMVLFLWVHPPRCSLN